MTTIHFVRHGEVHNPKDVFYARSPRFRLSTRGLEQAKAAAQYLKERPIVAVYSSPMLRARQTAAQIAGEHNLKVSVTALLNEIHTPFQGKPTQEMDAMGWRLYDDISAEYEQPADLVARIEKFARRMQKQFTGKEVVAVTHGDIVLHARMWARQMPLTYEARISIQPYPATASINTIILTDGIDLPEVRYHQPY